MCLFQSTQDCSPPFKFPKLESNFFKSLPNMKNISSADLDKAKMVCLKIYDIQGMFGYFRNPLKF